MAKKLKVELDVDNADAKKKVKEAVDEGSSGSGGVAPRATPPTPMPSTPTDDGLKKANDAAKNLARSFAGLGVSMAMRFSRQFVEPGSATDKALGVGEGAVTGAVMGAKLGPWGAAAGAVLGGAKGWMDNEKAEADRMRAEAEQISANVESIRSWNRAREETLAFKKTLDALTDAETSLADRQRMVAEEIKKREEAEKTLARAQFREATDAKADPSAFAKATADRQSNAARLDQLREIQNRLAKEVEPRHRNGMSAPDALARIGGDSGGGDWNFRELAANSREQLSVLKSIDSKTGKGETTWQ